jgi:hypothetical protein
MGNRRLIVFSMAMFILLPFAVVPYAHAKGLHCGLGDIRCLISAIKTANESGQPMRVSLAAGTYTLSAHDLLPSVTGNVTIVGASPVATVLDASGVFVFLGAVITVESNGTLTLQNLTVRGGDTGIANQGTSALLNTEVRDNLGAGGIFNLGTMTIVNSEIHDNFARLAPAGGIFNGSGTLTIVRSTIERNEGVEGTGGIENRGGMLSISDSMISENFGQFTGGVSNFSGELTIADSTFFNNTGGVVSAIDAGAVARISRTSIVGNRVGFGVFLGGSAIVGGNETSIENTTIVGNVANLPLGACCAVVGGVLINSTIADNVGTAGQVAFATLQNTIVDRTGFTAGVGPDCRSGITSLGNNIIGDPSGCVDALQASDRTG